MSRASPNTESTNSDGFWDRPEIEAVYGVHHVYSKKKFKVGDPYIMCRTPRFTVNITQDADELQKKADFIVNSVLERIDLDHDGKISPEELEKVGLDGLPNFQNIGAEGHHYDVESGMSPTPTPTQLVTHRRRFSEFFLHHEGETFRN